MVLSIIAIVNVILLPNIASIQDSAKKLSAKSTTRTLMIALEQYYFIHYEYPKGSNIPISQIIATLNGLSLLQSTPINPFTSQAYAASDSSGKILYSNLNSSTYRLVGYGKNNEKIIFEF